MRHIERKKPIWGIKIKKIFQNLKLNKIVRLDLLKLLFFFL